MALWGGRFGEETQNDVKIYSESISFDQRLYKHDIAGSKAHVAMLAKQGIIPAASAEAIRNELDKVCERIEKGDFSYDIAKEDIHMHVESALIDVLGAEGARVHSGRSRNDQVALDFRLYLRDAADYPIVKAVVERRFSANTGFIYVRGPVCRPGWLVEIEGIAVNKQGKAQFKNFI